jgi:hypothetical protein
MRCNGTSGIFSEQRSNIRALQVLQYSKHMDGGPRSHADAVRSPRLKTRVHSVLHNQSHKRGDMMHNKFVNLLLSAIIGVA